MSRLIVLPLPQPDESPEVQAIRAMFAEAFGDDDKEDAKIDE